MGVSQMQKQKEIEEQIADEKKKRRAILAVVLIILTVTVGAYVYYTAI
jgi:hypothetical protein